MIALLSFCIFTRGREKRNLEVIPRKSHYLINLTTLSILNFPLRVSLKKSNTFFLVFQFVYRVPNTRLGVNHSRPLSHSSVLCLLNQLNGFVFYKMDILLAGITNVVFNQRTLYKRHCRWAEH